MKEYEDFESHEEDFIQEESYSKKKFNSKWEMDKFYNKKHRQDKKNRQASHSMPDRNAFKRKKQDEKWASYEDF